MTARNRLRDKLCRELTQSDWDAQLHTRREAGRLGDIPPARALLAIAEHADMLAPDLKRLVAKPQPVGYRVARAIGSVFSALRHGVFDRVLATERSYRATMLGVRHGLDIVRLLRDVARANGDAELQQFCARHLAERTPLVEGLERELQWFADHAEVAVRSSVFAPQGDVPRRATDSMADHEASTIRRRYRSGRRILVS